MAKKADNQKLEQKEPNAESIISDRGYILHRQKIAEGAIEFMCSKEWKYLVLSKDAGAAEVKRRNTLYASRVYLEEIPKKGVPNISKDILEDFVDGYGDDFVCAVADFQHAIFKAIDEYVNAIDAIELEWWKENPNLY